MSTRTRERDTISTEPSYRQRAGGYTSPTFIGWAYVHGLPFREGITINGATVDTYSSKVGEVASITDVPSGHGLYNEVIHTKEVWNCPLMPVNNTHKSTFQNDILTVETTGLAAADPGAVGWAINRPSFGESESNLIQRAINRMEFGVQSAPINAPVFLGELRDFKTVAQKAAKWLHPKRGKSQFTRDLQNLSKKLQGYNALDAVRSIASADLLYQFAIKPFLSDVESMMQLGRHVNAQIDRLNSAKPVVVRGTASDSAQSEEIFFNAGSQNYYNSTTTNCGATRTCTAWAQIQYDFEAYPRPSEKLLLLDALGFDQPISTIWELVPWSFLVDYFLEVGNFLGQFDGSFYEPSYTVLQDGYSVKTERTGHVTTVYDGGTKANLWGTETENPVTTGTLYKSTYRRVKGPLNYDGIALPKFSLPNHRQLGNIAELLVVFNT